MRKQPRSKVIRVGHRKKQVVFSPMHGGYVHLHRRRVGHRLVPWKQAYEVRPIGEAPKLSVGTGSQHRAKTHVSKKKKLASQISSILRGGTIKQL